MAATADADGDAVSKPRGRSKIPLVAGALALVLALGAGAYFFIFRSAPASSVEETTAKSAVVFVDLPDLMVNLAGNTPRQQFLRLKIALEVSDERLAQQVQPMMPRIVDLFQVHLREMRPSDLEGSAGLYRLKDELLRRVNQAVQPAKVDAVLFREMLVQ